MAKRGRKKARRRGPKTFSLYDAAVSYGNLSILTTGLLGSGPAEAVLGSYDIGMTETRTSLGMGDFGRGTQTLSTQLTGGEQISLSDIMYAPQMSFDIIMGNAKTNMVPMMLAGVSFNFGAKIFRKVMRKQFASANRMIKPLGLGVRI